MEDPTSPLTNSSPHRTDTRTHPRSSLMPRSSETRSVPIIDASSCFTFSRLDPLRSSFGPQVSISHLVCFPLWSPQLFRIRYAAPALRSISPFYIVRFSISFSHWFSDVAAYPEPYLELRFSLRSVLYKVTQPLICSLASSTQSSLVSSLPRFALRPSRLKPSLTRNGSLRTL